MTKRGLAELIAPRMYGRLELRDVPVRVIDAVVGAAVTELGWVFHDELDPETLTEEEWVQCGEEDCPVIHLAGTMHIGDRGQPVCGACWEEMED